MLYCVLNENHFIATSSKPVAPEPTELPKQVTHEEPKVKITEQSPPPPVTTITPNSRGERIVPMKRMRKRVAERLKDAQNTYAMLSTFNEVDMTNITALRYIKDAFLYLYSIS